MSDDNRSAEVKTGLFVLTALAVLMVGSLWIVGSTPLSGGQAEYRILMKDSGGIRPGDRVRVAGVEVGRVRQVDLNPEEQWPVVFRVLLDTTISIRSDGSARIANAGLLGSPFLQIDPGSADLPLLPPGGEIHGSVPAGLDQALDKVDVISDEVVALLEQFRTVVSQVSNDVSSMLHASERFLSQENADNLNATLTAARTTLEASGPRLSSVLGDLKQVSGKLDEGLKDLPELMSTISSLAEGLQNALGPDGARLTQVLEATAAGVQSMDRALTAVSDNRPELDAAVRDLRDAAANLKQLSKQLKERPFSLVRIRPELERRPGQALGETP